MSKYYHSTTWTITPSHVGQVVSTNHWELSNYWASKLKPVVDVDLHSSTVDFLRGLGVSNEREATAIADFWAQCKHAGELLKEYIFEEVRRNEYAGAPSRKRAIFLFESSHDPSEYLSRMGFSAENRTLLEVEPTEKSSILHVQRDLLDCTLKSHEEIVDHARRYWAGSHERGLDSEVLLEGEFIITKLL